MQITSPVQSSESHGAAVLLEPSRFSRGLAPPAGYVLIEGDNALDQIVHTGSICAWIKRTEAYLQYPFGDDDSLVKICDRTGTSIGELESSYTTRNDPNARLDGIFIDISRQNAEVVHLLEAEAQGGGPKLNVLLVTENGDGTLSRCAMGVVHEEPWQQLPSEWCFVTLR